MITRLVQQVLVQQVLVHLELHPVLEQLELEQLELKTLAQEVPIEEQRFRRLRHYSSFGCSWCNRLLPCRH
jgi:hypothetical protein